MKFTIYRQVLKQPGAKNVRCWFGKDAAFLDDRRRRLRHRFSGGFHRVFQAVADLYCAITRIVSPAGASSQLAAINSITLGK